VISLLFSRLTEEDRIRILELRTRGFSSYRKRKGSQYAALWFEDDFIGKEKVRAMSVVLRTGGCSWSMKSNCSMCGYFVDSDEISSVVHQVEEALHNQGNELMIKLYTSGSFLDPQEISPTEQQKIIGILSERYDHVLIESRPEFINRTLLEDYRSTISMEVAVGLESATDEVLLHSINKGFTYHDYLESAEVLHSLDIPLRTYLLLKPPFMTEGAAIRDTKESIRAVEELSATISINPMNVQRNTLVEDMFRKGGYNPPYLWSLLEVLKTGSSSRLISSPSGGGTPRGIHNCGRCDKEILKKIGHFSTTQDPGDLAHSCECRGEWEDLLLLEDTVSASVRIK